MSSFNELEVPASVAAGAWLSCESLTDMYVTIGGTFVATLQVQYTVRGDANASNIGSALTAAGAVQIPMRAKKIRINTTAYTSGAPWAVLSSEG